MRDGWKSAIFLICLVIAITVLAMGCGAQKTTPTTTPTKAPATTSTPTLSSTAAPTAAAKPVVLKASSHFWSKNDPINDHWGAQIHSMMFDRLLRLNEAGEIVPQVAIRWTLVDNKTWRFYLRNDVKWHDGTPVTARDFKYSLDEGLDHGSPLGNFRPLNITGAEVVDDYAVDVKMSDLNIEVPAAMLHQWIVPKAYIDKVGGYDKFIEKPLGSSPWKWSEWVAWDHTFADRFSGGHAFRKPYIDRIELYDINNTETAVSSLRTGAVEFASGYFFPEQAKALEKQGFKVQPTTGNITTVTVYPVDACRLGYPTCDKRVRQALDWALDKKTMAETLWLGYAVPLSQPGFPTHAGYNKDIPVHYDPKKAEQLLDEAGFPRGKDGWRMEIRFMNWMAGMPEQMALAYVDMWSKVGIKANYEKVDISVQLKYCCPRERDPYPLAQFENADSYGDNSVFVFLCDDPTAKKCSTPYGNKDFFALRAKFDIESDPLKRAKIAEQLFQIMVDDPVNLWSTTVPVFAIYKPDWTGFEFDSRNYLLWDNMRRAK